MKVKPLDFLDVWNLADCAARVFAEDRTSKNAEEWSVNSRQILRRPAVAALRHLWKTGDPGQRATVACRIAVWMERPIEGFGMRIQQREETRLKRSKHKGRDALIAAASEMPE